MTDATALLFSEDQGMLRVTQPRYHAVTELASDFIYCMNVDPHGSIAIEWVTDAFTRITGYTLAEIRARGGWIVLAHPDDLRIVLHRTQKLTQGHEADDVYRIVTKSGDVRWVHDRGRPEWDANHERVLRICGAAQDITAFTQQEDANRAQVQGFHALFDLYPHPMWVYDLESLRFLSANEAACTLYGYSLKEFLTMTLADIRPQEDAPLLRAYVSTLPPILTGRIVHHRTRDGRLLDAEITSHAVYFAGRWARHVHAHDVTVRVKTERDLRHAAEHDSATGLPNRMVFMERLERCIRAARDDPSYRFAVLFVDLDHFKEINDRFGHLAGDQLLTIISRRLSQSLRPRDLVARLGGDEFTVLLDGMADEETALQVAARLGREVAAPISFASEIIRSTASIGVILGNGGDDQPERLLRDADSAMYRAKEAGRAQHVMYHASGISATN